MLSYLLKCIIAIYLFIVVVQEFRDFPQAFKLLAQGFNLTTLQKDSSLITRANTYVYYTSQTQTVFILYLKQKAAGVQEEESLTRIRQWSHGAEERGDY